MHPTSEKRTEVKQLVNALEDLVDLVADKFDWADTPKQNDICDVGNESDMCTECRSSGCISLKLQNARAAIAKATGA